MGLPFLLQLTTRLLFSGLQWVPLVRQIDQPLLEFCLPATMRAGRAPLTFALLMGAEARGFRDAEDIQTGSKIHQLTESSLTSLKGSCAASNSIGCGHISGGSLFRVCCAQMQTVAGTDVIEAGTSAGSLVLKAVEATLLTASVDVPFAIVQQRLVEEEMTLDVCSSGKQRNGCGSLGQAPCTEEAPMCMGVCEACPADKPVWQVHSGPV